MFRRGCLFVSTFALFGLHSLLAGRVDSHTVLDRITAESVGWLSDYLKIDTSNPPGREAQGAAYLAAIFRKEGIACLIFSSAPGRANVYARLKGRRPTGGIALVHHIDVVPVQPAAWKVPPFSGLVQDGYVWGRGAIDSKGLGIVHLASFIGLKRSGFRPDRDIVFVATADEESGSKAGLEWVLENRPEVFEGVEFALTEGGTNIVRDGRLLSVGVEITQKVPVWLRLTASGAAGHAAYVGRNAAPNRLIRALDRLVRYQSPVVVGTAVADYLREIAVFQQPELRERLLRIEESAAKPDVISRLDPVHQVLLHNTIAVTVIKAGFKTNIVPDTAYAELDCRLVPGQDPEEFIATVAEIINDPSVVVEPFLFASPGSSPSDTELFEVLRQSTLKIERHAAVVPSVLAGFSDSRFLREAGITSYGFDPFKIQNGQAAGVHGVDERLAVSDLDFAIRYFYQVLSDFVFLRGN